MKFTAKFILTTVIVLIIGFSTQLVNAYDNAQYGFSITPPSNWVTTNSDPFVVTFSEPNDTARISIFIENTTLNLNDYASLGKQNLELTFKDYNYSLLSEQNRTIGNLNCYEIVYSYTGTNNVNDNITLQIKSVIFVENQKAFVVHYITTKSNYFTYSVETEQSIVSFRILGTTTLPSPSIPEFPSWIILPLAVITTLSASLLIKEERKRRVQI